MSSLIATVYHAQADLDPTTRTLHKAGLGTASPERAALAIAAAAQQHRESWQKGAVLGKVSPDQPGPMRSYQRIMGDPRTYVANQITKLVVAERGFAAASAEEHRPVYGAMALLWEWATGLPDEDSNLRNHIRLGVQLGVLESKMTKVQRERETEIARYHDAMMTDLSLAGSVDLSARKKHQAQVAKLDAEADRLRAERVALLQRS